MEYFDLTVIPATNDPNDLFGRFEFIASDENSYYFHVMNPSFQTKYFTFDMLKNNLLWEIGKSSDEKEPKVYGNYITRPVIFVEGTWKISDHIKYGKFDHFTRVRAYQQQPVLLLYEALYVMSSKESSTTFEKEMKKLFQNPKYQISDHPGTEVANITHIDLQIELDTLLKNALIKPNIVAYKTYEMPSNMADFLTHQMLETPKDAEERMVW